MASLIRKRRRGNTTRTTTTKPNKTVTTVSKGTTVKTGAGSHRVTHTTKWDGGSSSAYITETHRNSSGYTRTTRKMGVHKKSGRKAVFKGKPTKKVRSSNKGFDVDLGFAESIGVIVLCLIVLALIMFPALFFFGGLLALALWLVHRTEPKPEAIEETKEKIE